MIRLTPLAPIAALIFAVLVAGCAVWRVIDYRVQTVAASDMRPVPVTGDNP